MVLPQLVDEPINCRSVDGLEEHDRWRSCLSRVSCKHYSRQQQKSTGPQNSPVAEVRQSNVHCDALV